ncbi:fasciclin domain-containing protein [Brevundimonas sp.]|uniref:fasciclin domain-containing protein n=1 Tax=Brevundimonas sp. TaxID=1871086 RepID=UPI003D09C199
MTLNPLRGIAVATLVSAGLLASGCMSMGSEGMGDGMGMSASAQADVTVGGAPMYANKTIVENAVNSPIHTTLVAAVTAAGLVDTLSGPGPFTVFAPTNDAFAKLPAGTVDTLVQPANRATLTKILTYHVVAGRLSAADIMQRIRAGNGRAALTTVEGGTLTASMRGNSVIVTDEKGGVATITQADVFQSNGVIHVTDTVSMPN